MTRPSYSGLRGGNGLTTRFLTVLSVLSLSAGLLLMAACAGGGAASPSTSSSRLTTTDTVWQHLQTRRQFYSNLKGLAQLQLRLQQGGGTLDSTVVVMDRFDRLRLEGIGPFGQPLFLLIAAEQKFGLYLPQEQRVLEGRTTPASFARLFGFEIEPQMLPHLLLGDVPFQTFPAPGRLAYLADDELYIWEGQAPPQVWHYRVWIDPYRLLPVRVEVLDAERQIVLRAAYEDFRSLDGMTVPYQITISQPSTDRWTKWRYDELRLNQGVSPKLFEMRVPPGSERVQLN